MKSITKLFVPFESVSARWFTGLAIFQAITLIVVWILSPNQLLPGPIEIFHAWDNLAKNQGMLVELMVSAATIWQALAYTILISLIISMLATASFFKHIAKWSTALRFLG